MGHFVFWGLLCVHETCSQRHVQTCSEACSGGFMAISKNTAPVCMNSFSCPAVCKKHPAASRRNHSPRIDLCIILHPIGKIVLYEQVFFPIGNFIYDAIDIIPDREYNVVERVISCELIRLQPLSGKTEKLPD